MVSLGFHIGQLIFLLTDDWSRADFSEMLLHHLVTVFLFSFSYLSNQMIGGPVTFLHNWADVTTSFTRIWSDTHYFKPIALPSFIFTVMVWFYSRLFVFATLIYSYLSIDFYVQSPIMQPIFGFLLSCLYVLHVYWFSLFMKMIAGAIFKK